MKKQLKIKLVISTLLISVMLAAPSYANSCGSDNAFFSSFYDSFLTWIRGDAPRGVSINNLADGPSQIRT